MDTDPSVAGLLDLTGQEVLVTGASGHLGCGIARRLAAAGASIVAHAHHNAGKAGQLVADLAQGRVLTADLTDPDAVDALVAEASPALVVNNAAIQPVTPLARIDSGEWRRVQQAVVDAAFAVTQAAASRWRASQQPGAIVNIASIEGLDPAAGHAHYAAGKAALLMFTRAAALEYGPDGIRVNAVSPGLIARDGLEEDWPDGVRRWRERAPLGRLGVPNDIADAVLFLLSPAARWITGANLVVDGGMTAQSRW
jgi:NAD(P)-dependent dehydrogenase (short-subunit alcohol dehydrogenase family)